MPDAQVRQVSLRLDKALVPHDALWLDLDHTNDTQYFTFHPFNFGDPGKFQSVLDRHKRKLVVVVDPHLKANQTYPLYATALQAGLFVNTSARVPFVGRCWPGASAWLDFLNPAVRAFWERQFTYGAFPGSRPNLWIWNDMNEPSVFEAPDASVPRDLRHFGGFEEREVHNIYGHLMISATFGGLLKRDPQPRRPFVMSRSYFAGSQKYAVVRTGDNTADWVHLHHSIAQVLAFGLSGMPFSGADVGGFFDSPDSTLLARWYQVGAWTYPFFRCHCHHASATREIYTLDGEDEKVAGEAICIGRHLTNNLDRSRDDRTSFPHLMEAG
jgi:alpha 1,3-glucosidase